MSLKYFNYDNYLSTQVTEIDEYKPLPNILICLNDKLSLVDLITELDNELINSRKN